MSKQAAICPRWERLPQGLAFMLPNAIGVVSPHAWVTRVHSGFEACYFCPVELMWLPWWSFNNLDDAMAWCSEHSGVELGA